MAARAFVDTNVLLYLCDERDPARKARARSLFEESREGDLVLSSQVLEEFYWNATRKVRPPLTEAAAAAFVATFAAMPIVPVDGPLVLAAIARSRDARIPFWDALIVETALVAGCEVLYSEDFQEGRAFDGLKVVNPLR